jgi:hypothetical protein
MIHTNISWLHTRAHNEGCSVLFTVWQPGGREGENRWQNAHAIHASKDKSKSNLKLKTSTCTIHLNWRETGVPGSSKFSLILQSVRSFSRPDKPDRVVLI